MGGFSVSRRIHLRRPEHLGYLVNVGTHLPCAGGREVARKIPLTVGLGTLSVLSRMKGGGQVARKAVEPIVADVRRSPLISTSPRVFRAKDLAYRYGIGPAIITRWLKDGRMPQPDTFTAEGTVLGWSPQHLAAIEANSPFLRERFERVTATMPVSDP